VFLRIRWFALGVLSTSAVFFYAVGKLVWARERLTPVNLRRYSVVAAADAVGLAARLIAPRAH
jgi:hypothetical protein